MEQTITEKNIASMLSNQMADAVERVSSALVLVNGRQGRPASGIVYAQDLVLTADHGHMINVHSQRNLLDVIWGQTWHYCEWLILDSTLLLKQLGKHESVNLCWQLVDHRMKGLWQVLV